jgi:alkanesulfonate monooxygenase SsuD/methylene tetrahydromethanopterin reductase-like flavin-dependent oxidoreductase (luciferase family)
VSIPASHIEPKPVQRPRPPIYLGGYAPGALERIGRRADGWLAPGLPLSLLPTMWNAVRRSAERAGRDPAALRLIIRMNPKITDRPVDADRLPRQGTVGQLAEYAVVAARAGADEVFVDLHQTASSVSEMLELAERFAGALSLRPAPS